MTGLTQLSENYLINLFLLEAAVITPGLQDDIAYFAPSAINQKGNIRRINFTASMPLLSTFLKVGSLYLNKLRIAKAQQLAGPTSGPQSKIKITTLSGYTFTLNGVNMADLKDELSYYESTPYGFIVSGLAYQTIIGETDLEGSGLPPELEGTGSVGGSMQYLGYYPIINSTQAQQSDIVYEGELGDLGPFGYLSEKIHDLVPNSSITIPTLLDPNGYYLACIHNDTMDTADVINMLVSNEDLPEGAEAILFAYFSEGAGIIATDGSLSLFTEGVPETLDFTIGSGVASVGEVSKNFNLSRLTVLFLQTAPSLSTELPVLDLTDMFIGSLGTPEQEVGFYIASGNGIESPSGPAWLEGDGLLFYGEGKHITFPDVDKHIAESDLLSTFRKSGSRVSTIAGSGFFANDGEYWLNYEDGTVNLTGPGLVNTEIPIPVMEEIFFDGETKYKGVYIGENAHLGHLTRDNENYPRNWLLLELFAINRMGGKDYVSGISNVEIDTRNDGLTYLEMTGSGDVTYNISFPNSNDDTRLRARGLIFIQVFGGGSHLAFDGIINSQGIPSQPKIGSIIVLEWTRINNFVMIVDKKVFYLGENSYQEFDIGLASNIYVDEAYDYIKFTGVPNDPFLINFYTRFEGSTVAIEIVEGANVLYPFINTPVTIPPGGLLLFKAFKDGSVRRIA